MAVQRQQSDLMRKYGGALDAAVRKAAANPISYGVRRLPGGIKNGIAQLVECRFGKVEEGKQNAGELYFRAAGVILEPHSVTTPDGKEVVVAGEQTSIFRMVGEQRGANRTVSMQENVDWIVNEMKKLGGEALFAGAQGGDLEQLAESIVQASPYFTFETRESLPVKNPDGTTKYEARVWETWFGQKGLPDNYAPPEPNGVDDRTGGGAAGGGGPAKAPTRANGVQTGKAGAAAPAAAKGGRNAAVATVAPPADEPDLAALAEAADGDDPDGAGREAMVEAVVNAGWTQEQVDAWTGTWGELAEHIAGGGGPPEPAEGGGDAAEGDDGGVKVGYLYKYSPIDPKTKKPQINPKTKKKVVVECEVKKVDEAKGTVDLLNLDDKKTTYRAVPFDQLIGE